MNKLKGKELYEVKSFMGKRFWPYIFGVVGFNGVMAFCFNIVMAIIMKDLFNSAVKGSGSLFFRAIIVGVSSLLLALIVNPFFGYIYKRAQKQTMKDIRIRAYNHMIKLSIPYFEKNHSGNIMSRLTNDIKIIENIYDYQIGRIAFVLLLGLGSTIVMFVYDWRIALYALTFEGLSIATSVKISKRIRAVSDEVQEGRSKVTEKFMDIISGFKTTKVFQIEDKIIADYKNESSVLVIKERKRDDLDALINTTSHFFESAKSLGTIIIGLYFLSRGTWDIGTLIAMFNLQNNMGVLSQLGDTIGKLQASLAGVARVKELLNEEPERAQCLEVKKINGSNLMIKLDDVSFSYEQKKVLDNISLSLYRGESVGIIGKSGSGKSTLAKLLLGFYNDYEGAIELGGDIAYVPQSPYLFNGTIKENIMYGKLDATDDEIIEAAKKANAHDFIMEQENGYDTIIGEEGSNLSGGQKQRIAVARAIIKNAEVLLLDEFTSALDSESEEQVQRAIEKLMEEKTVIIIAHRLSTIKNVDRVIELKEGKIAS